MASPGSQQRPVIVKVTTEKMAQQVTALCGKYRFYFIAGLEAKEDLTDLKRAIKEKTAPDDVYAPCPCGSGLKYKFCCRKNEIKLDL